MYLPQKKLDLLCLFCIYSLDSFGIAIIYPIFTPIFLLETSPFFSLAASVPYKTLLLGLLLALFPIAQFIGVPFIGDFSDKIGRKKAFSFTLLGSGIAYFLTAISLSFYSIELLFISRFFSGFFAGNTSLCFASLSDISGSHQERSKNFGLLAAFGGVSFLLAILFGVFFLDTETTNAFSASIPFYTIAVLSIVVFTVTLFFFQDVTKKTENAKFSLAKGVKHIISSLRIQSLRRAYAVFFFFSIGWIASMQFYPSILLLVYKKSPLHFTVNLLIAGAVWSLANFFVQRLLMNIFSSIQVLFVATPLLVFFLLSCLLPQSYLSFSIHFSLSIFLAALVWTNALALVSLMGPKEIQGRIMGINQSFASLASILAALTGAFFTGIYPISVFFLGALCTALAFLSIRKIEKNLHY